MPKQEKYNLQRLLEVRERARENAAQFLAQCRLKLAKAEEELEKRKQAVIDNRKKQSNAQNAMLEKFQTSVKNREILAHRQHLTDLRELETELLAAVEKQKQAVERHEKEVEDALLAVKEATKEAQIIEKHKEKWQRTRKIEANRREQKTNDAIGALLHEQNKSS